MLSKPDWQCGRGIIGGHLKDVPKPHVRFFSDQRYRRKVYLTCGIYSGIGIHFHVMLQEEHDDLWDSKENCWRQSWDDVEGKGRSFSETFATEPEAKEWARKIARRHFRRHKIMTMGGLRHRWFYREGD